LLCLRFKGSLLLETDLPNARGRYAYSKRNTTLPVRETRTGDRQMTQKKISV